MSAALLFSALLLVPSLQRAELGPNQPFVAVQGDVELRQVDALKSAEQAATKLLWERNAEAWRRAAGFWVPEPRLRQELQHWLARSMDTQPVLKKSKMQVFESTVGRAYRQRLDVQVQGKAAARFQQSGERRARAISQLFLKRYLGILGLWAALLFIGLRLDRGTRGYLTKRIGLAGLCLGALGAFVLYPGSAALL